MTGTLSLRDQGQRQDYRSLRTLAFLLLAGSVRCSLLDDSLSLSVPHLLFFCGPSFNVTAMGFWHGMTEWGMLLFNSSFDVQ